jgi:hypothetical protein
MSFFYKKKHSVRGPSSTETVTDEDGQLYSAIKIGKQVWTAENLWTTKINNVSC